MSIPVLATKGNQISREVIAVRTEGIEHELRCRMCGKVLETVELKHQVSTSQVIRWTRHVISCKKLCGVTVFTKWERAVIKYWTKEQR